MSASTGGDCSTRGNSNIKRINSPLNDSPLRVRLEAINYYLLNVHDEETSFEESDGAGS